MSPKSPTGQQTVAEHADRSSVPSPTRRRVRTWLVILMFCMFAGLIAETFMTPSTSPLDFVLRPYIVPFNMLLYGTFDLLAREIIVMRRLGLTGVVLLGAAYGFINEGVAAGTWYVVHPPGYTFIGGIDWAWAVSLTLFHAIISVITPIAFIEILFSSIQRQPLLRRRGIVACVVLLYACIFVAMFVLSPEPLPQFFYRLSVLAVATLFLLFALAAPSRQSAPIPGQLPGLWRLRIAGFVAMFAFFSLNMLFPTIVAALLQSRPGGIIIAQGVDCAMFLAFGALVFARGWTWSRRAGWSPRQNLALLLGGVTFTTLLLNLTAAAMGEVFSTLPFYALLIVLTLRWQRRAKSDRLAAIRAR